MKKIIFIIISFLFLIPNIYASEKINVTLNKCVDGDTAWFNLNNKTIKARFLAIDTPESTNKKEPYGKEASEYTCSRLTNASNIQIEYDENSDKQDKYNRELVWVFVDGNLLQKSIVDQGLAEVKYIYGDYKYLDELNKSLEQAKIKKLNIWKNYNNNIDLNYFYITVGIVIFGIAFCFNSKYRKKVIRKQKRKINKEIKKLFD